MTTGELLLQTIAAGLVVEAGGERLLVRPKGQISDELRTALVAQRGDVLAALCERTSMAAILASVPPRPCADCELLHAGVYCLHYQATMPEPGRLRRCVALKPRVPALPW